MTRHMTRREFLKSATLLGTGFWVAGHCGCARGPLTTTPNANYQALTPAAQNGAVTLGYYERLSPYEICERVISDIDDLSWFSKGDSLFVKVACNSAHPHPAVTAPDAVRGIVKFFKARGAGKIYVGDQAGVEHVRLTQTDRRSSTREIMARNGLLDAVEESTAILHCFDDHGWEGYTRVEPDFSGVWRDGVVIPKILTEVDHIINLPRIGAHAVAGYTLGLKNGVGWLRDDCRLELHQQGATFYEKIAEINHYPAIRNKLRFTLTLAHKALLNIGPDIGAKYDFKGTLAIAAKNLMDHDYLASVLIPWLDQHNTSFFDLYAPYPKHVNYWNRFLVKKTWGAEAIQAYQPIVPPHQRGSIKDDPCLAHLGWLTRYRPEHIRITSLGQALPQALIEYLTAIDSGIFLL